MPVAESLAGYISDYPAVLICTMSDGSKRIITMTEGAPSGSFVSEYNSVQCSITPAPAPYGTTEQQPDTMLINFAEFQQDLSIYPFEPIRAELRFTQYDYDPDEGKANWSVALFADGVMLTDEGFIYRGDSWIRAEVE